MAFPTFTFFFLCPHVARRMSNEVVEHEEEESVPQRPPSEEETGNESGGGYAIIEFVRTKARRQIRHGCARSSSDTKTILHPMTIELPEGCVTALLGPSGAGKSTLLDFVTGGLRRSVQARGEVNLPDSDAYVPQDDRLHGFYTCQSYMEHYTRLSGRKVDKEAEDQISEILDGLGLSRQKDTVVGDMFKRGLSGGQKRRLSVALEALSRPLNLTLDEPTSGLDSESALQVMKFLQEYARKGDGRRVLLTIHQPSSFIWELVDHVILLSKGMLMYQGPREEMEEFFSAHGSPTPNLYNPADHYLTVVNDEFSSMTDERSITPEHWAKHYQEWKESNNQGMFSQSQMPKKLSGPLVSVVGSSIILRINAGNVKEDWTWFGHKTLNELIRRYFVNLVKNPGILGLRVIIYCALSLVLGVLFFDIEYDTTLHAVTMSRAGLLYFVVAFFTSMSVAVVPFTIIERGIVEKEVRNHRYHPCFYHAAFALASVPGVFLLALLTSLILLSMTKLIRPLKFGVNLFLVLNCAEALAQLVSHIAQDFVVALAFLSGVFGMFTLLQGFLILPSQFPPWLLWTYYIPCNTYSFRSFMYNEYSGQEFPEASLLASCNNSLDEIGKQINQTLPDDVSSAQERLSDLCDVPDTTNGEGILRYYEMEDVNFAHDMVVLVGWAFIVHILSFIYLHIKWLRHRRCFVYTDEPL